MVSRVRLQLQVVVAADFLPDGVDDFEQKPGPVSQRATVLVGPIVDRRAEKLRDQISVGAVKLDAVDARLLGRRAASANWRTTSWISVRVIAVQRMP